LRESAETGISAVSQALQASWELQQWSPANKVHYRVTRIHK